MIDRRRQLQILAAAAVVGLLFLWYRALEWETRQVDRGPTQEARQNPVLALQRLLEQREVPVSLVRGFGTLERMEANNTPIGTGDTLVLLNSGHGLRESQVDALWRWMEEGGQLLVTADNPYFDMEYQADTLLGRLDLMVSNDYWNLLYEAEDAEEDEQDESTKTTAEASAEDANESQDDGEQPIIHERCTEYVALPLHLPEYGPDPLLMEFASGYAFTAGEGSDVHALASYQDQIFFARRRVGAGAISLLPGMEPLSNDVIHCADNAFILWQLLKNSNKVWLVVNTDSPSFWRYLWQFSALGCVMMLAALAAWLWHRVPRFGPVLTPHNQGRRRFMDHIQASAHFILRHQGNSALATSLREDLWHRLRLRHPGLEHLDPAAQAERIHQFSGMAVADVQLALFRPLPVPPQDFVDMVQRLQHLRNAL
jgi:hypothetical protein